MSSTTATYVPTADDLNRIEKLHTMALAYFQTGHNKMVGLQETSAKINSARPALYACKTLAEYRAAQVFFHKTSTTNTTMSFCKELLADAQKMCHKADAIAAVGYPAVAAAASSRKGKRSLQAVDIAPEAEAEPEAAVQPEAVKVKLEPEDRPAALGGSASGPLIMPALEAYIDEINVASTASSPDHKRPKLAAASATPVDRINSVMRYAADMYSAAIGGAAAPAQQPLVAVKLEKSSAAPAQQPVQVKLEQIKPAIPAEDFYLISSDDDEEMQEAQTLLVQHQPVHLETRSDSPSPCPMHEDSDDDTPIKPAAGAAKPKNEAKPKDQAKPKNEAKPKTDKAAASEADKQAEKPKQAPRALGNRGKSGKGLGKKSATKVVYAEMYGVWEPEIVTKVQALTARGLYSFEGMNPKVKLALRTMPKEHALISLDQMLDTKETIDNPNTYVMTVLDGVRTMYKIPKVAAILQRWEHDDHEVDEQDQETMDEWEEVQYAWNMHADKWVDLIVERMTQLSDMKRFSFGKLANSPACMQLQTLPAHLAGDLLAKLRDETGTIADVHAYIVKNAKRLRSRWSVESAQDVWAAMQDELDEATKVDERVDDTEDEAEEM